MYLFYALGSRKLIGSTEYATEVLSNCDSELQEPRFWLMRPIRSSNYK